MVNLHLGEFRLLALEAAENLRANALRVGLIADAGLLCAADP